MVDFRTEEAGEFPPMKLGEAAMADFAGAGSMLPGCLLPPTLLYDLKRLDFTAKTPNLPRRDPCIMRQSPSRPWRLGGEVLPTAMLSSKAVPIPFGTQGS